MADGQSERGAAGPAGLARASNHTAKIDWIDEMNQTDRPNQLPATRREMVPWVCSSWPLVFFPSRLT